MSQAQSQQGEVINLAKLSLQQLDQLKQQFSDEINLLQESLARLKMVQSSFVSADDC